MDKDELELCIITMIGITMIFIVLNLRGATAWSLKLDELNPRNINNDSN